MDAKVRKVVRVALALGVVLAFFAVPAMAQDQALPADVQAQRVEFAKAQVWTWKPLVAIGAGLVTLGGGIGIGILARAAMEGSARQPEAAGAIRTSMIIAAALIEGFTFFALVVCIIAT